MKRNIRSYVKAIAIVTTLGIALTLAAMKTPRIMERFYIRYVFRPISRVLNSLTGVFPFSVGELMIALLALWFLWRTTEMIIALCRRQKSEMRRARMLIVRIAAAAATIYFLIVISWNLSYYRLPFSEIAGLDVRPSSASELERVCGDLIGDANSLRSSAKEDAGGRFHLPGGYRDVFSRAYLGYRKASAAYPDLGGDYQKPKDMFFSEVMSWAGLCGVYYPLTGEANVNIRMPDSLIPSTACHEMAHQRGFAREDEANYISYVTCIANPGNDFKYSGTLLALTYCMNSLYQHDRPAFSSLSKEYGDGLKRDLMQINEYWDGYEGPVERIYSSLNDVYLKSNMQTDGVSSYGRMVDLMIARYRAEKSR